MHDSDYMYLQQPMNTLNSGVILYRLFRCPIDAYHSSTCVYMSTISKPVHMLYLALKH